MSTRAYYHPRDLLIDLAELPRWLYDEIASLHGQIDPPPAAPILTCAGNGAPMYVWRHESGRYFARHYPGGNPDRHQHRIATMSDEHRRQAEYTARAATEGGCAALTEHSTGGGTRLDVAVFGDIQVGVEVQRSHLSRASAKTRAWKSYDAGWPTAWVTDRADDPDWAGHVPTGRLTTRGVWSERIPPSGTAKIIIGEYRRQRDPTRRNGWRYERTPRTITLDELAVRMPAGEIVPVRIGTRGQVDLAFSNARDVIDSCTYPGASRWRPTTDTPRHKETAQSLSRACHEETPELPQSDGAEMTQQFTVSSYKACCISCGRRTLWRIEACATCQKQRHHIGLDTFARGTELFREDQP